MRVSILLISVVALAAFTWAVFGGGAVAKHAVWVIPYDYAGKIEVTRGDVIELWTKPLPVIRENLEVSFRASKQGKGVELVGQTLPHKEGTMERLFFFKAFDPGPAKLKVELLEKDGSVRETWAYQVEVKPPRG